MTQIINEAAVLALYDCETRELCAHKVYKYTDCGAWITFHDWGVHLGSIVEGCDFGTLTYPLRYPFTEDHWYGVLADIEAEASQIWDWANEPRDKNGRRHRFGKTMADQGCDAPDFASNYETHGRSS